MDLELLATMPSADAHGTPILFVHDAFHGAWCWRHWLPYVADHGFAAYAVSLRGHGASAGREALATARLDDYVDDVGWALARIGRPAVLVGHGMAGPVTVLGAARFARHVRVLALLTTSTAHIARPRLAGLRQALRSAPGRLLAQTQAALRGTGGLYQPITTAEQFRRSFLSPALPDVDLHAYFPLVQPESPAAIAQIEQGSFKPDLSGLEAPVVVIGAQDDALVRADDVRATAALFRTEARFVRGGHDLMLDAHWIEAAALLLTLLSEHGIPPGGVTPLRTHAGDRSPRAIAA